MRKKIKKIVALFKRKTPQASTNERRSFLSGVLIELPMPKVAKEISVEEFNERSRHIHEESRKMYESKIVSQ